MTGESHGQRLEAARLHVGLDMHDLWLGYFSIGGSGTQAEIAAYLGGSNGFDGHQHDVLVQALNDRYTELDQNHPVPYLSD